MTDLVFRSAGHVHPVQRRAATAATLPSRRERLAIVVTGDALCGIAAYAAALQRTLAGAFDVTMIPLDQYRLRGRGRRMRQLGNRHIAEICAGLAQFDAVNLQLEHGTLGRRADDIHRRFSALVSAAPRLSVTFHTLPLPERLHWEEIARAALRLRFADAARRYGEHRRNRLLTGRIARRLRRAQREKPVAAIVHTRKNARDATYLYGVDAVFDHPLAFLSAGEAAAIRARASRRDFPLLDALPDQAVLIGVFGFISHYKGFTTVIRALRQLPADHHLLIFGGIHPKEIARDQALHPDLRELFDEARVEGTLYDELTRAGRASLPWLTLDRGGRGIEELFGPDPRALTSRIHFMGALAEDDFLAGMASCDAVVFPYLEVGQSSSGPISLALELGCRIIASRTLAFLGFAEYHPQAVEFFDIGNHLELAGRLRARRHYPEREGIPDYNVETNKAVYVAANTGPLPADRPPRPSPASPPGSSPTAGGLNAGMDAASAAFRSRG